MNIEELLKDRILVLDGAMGTMVQRYALSETDFRGDRFAEHPMLLKGNNDILVLTRPEIIREIHSKYLAAGADIIETCTFNANRISQAEYGCEGLCYEINRSAAELARKVADEYSTAEKPRFVAGSVGPTSRTCSMSPDVENPAYRNVTFDELAVAYKEQMTALIEGGVDVLLCETTESAGVVTLSPLSNIASFVNSTPFQLYVAAAAVLLLIIVRVLPIKASVGMNTKSVQ